MIKSDQLLEHWQGHRRLTRRLIEAFPEDRLFRYSVGGMRPFAEFVIEMIRMCGPGIVGMLTDKWETEDGFEKQPARNKEDLLKQWDRVTEDIDRLFPQIPESRFQEVANAFGQYKGPVYWTLMYFIDNEIHHRGQAYVYMRSLGIPPPPFWER